MKLVIVHKWPKRIIFFYVQKIKEFPGAVPGFAAQVYHQSNNGLQFILFGHAGQKFRAAVSAVSLNVIDALFTRQSGIVIIDILFRFFLLFMLVLDCFNLGIVAKSVIKHVSDCHAVIDLTLEFHSQKHKDTFIGLFGELQNVAVSFHRKLAPCPENRGGLSGIKRLKLFRLNDFPAAEKIVVKGVRKNFIVGKVLYCRRIF